MKLEYLVVDDNDDGDEFTEFYDLYIDQSEILGFYVPSDFLEYGKPVINLLLKGGHAYTVIQKKELKEYLDDKFKEDYK